MVVGLSMASAVLRESEIEGMYESALGSDIENEEDETKTTIATGETKALSRLRIGVFAVLFICTITISVVSFVYLKSSEKETFETEYYDQASRLTLGIQSDRRIKTVRSFAESITSHAAFHGNTWPNVTLPDNEIQAGAAAALADLMSVILVPVVDEWHRTQWEEYSVENQGWLKESLEVQERTRRKLEGSVGNLPGPAVRDLSIPPFIHRADGLDPTPEDGPGPFLPQWQMYPAVEVPELVNLNILSHIGYRDASAALLRTESAVYGRSFDFTDTGDLFASRRRGAFELFLQKWDGEEEYADDPVADLYWPIFDAFDASTRKLVGLLSGGVYWRLYFENILSEKIVLDVVLENTCEQTYSYRVDGPNVQYLGKGDLHGKGFDDFAVAVPDGIFQQGDFAATGTQGSCRYSAKIYPSQAFQDLYVTSTPAVATAVLVVIFLFTSAVFIVYDCLVERRQRVVMDTAVASSAIVSSLFPANVRDRLYNRDENSEAEPSQIKAGTDRSKEKDPADEQDDEGETAVVHKSKPIADLFQNCTVLFADIVGFTSWSSGREPTDVFILLEALYGEFDKIANKRSVFKVETIGDCYLAVTGLPTPQKDHAVVMSLFAHECKRKMKLLLVQELRNALSGDLSSLALRFGLHSGPVTAGVLRGEKSRFQLFGDTVNTAARMESTSERNKIHVSQGTADTLVISGKAHWLLKRPDSVQAKGKGTMVTYWVQPRAFRPSSDQKRTDAILAEVMARQGLSAIEPIQDSESEPQDDSESEKGEETADILFNRSANSTDSASSARGEQPEVVERAKTTDSLGNPQDATIPAGYDESSP
jgi:class 3 adenylate cyclase